jgi:Protein of unknown function (DUF2934)
MHPTSDQIQFAAYHRWLSRGGRHGHDQSDWLGAEKELKFLLNYQTIVEYCLESDFTRVLGSRGEPTCRLCERSTDEVSFDEPCPVIPFTNPSTRLLTAEVCSECRADCLNPLATSFRHFVDGQTGLTLNAYKALVAAALLIMPARELGYFPDTMEWVNNPDPTCDASLFAGSSCRVYSIATDQDAPWVSLARRVDDEVAMPYMVLLVSEGHTVIQVDIPLCLRDEDLDGIGTESPERSWVCSDGSDDRGRECQRIAVEIPGLRLRAGLLARV